MSSERNDFNVDHKFQQNFSKSCKHLQKINSDFGWRVAEMLIFRRLKSKMFNLPD